MEMNKTLLQKASSPNPRKRQPLLFTSPSATIAPYILLKLLIRMRDQLSREAMEQFTRNYLEMIETNYPRLKLTVTEALEEADLNKFYHDLAELGEEKRRHGT